MNCLSRPILTISAFLISTTAAFADLTAEDVWADWKAYFNGFGYSVEGQQEHTGVSLTITGVTISTLGETTPGGASLLLDRIVLTELDDGRVSIDLPAVMPMEMSAAGPDGGLTRISLDYRQSGLSVLASGSPEALRYDFAADRVSIVTTGMEIDGEIQPAEANQVEIAFETLSGATDVTVGIDRLYEQALQVASMRYSFKAESASEAARSDVSGQTQALAFKGESILPANGVDPTDMDAMLAAGFRADGTFTYAANAMTLAVSSPQNQSETSIISGSGQAAVRMGQDGITYDLAQQALAIEMSSPQIPLPLSFNVGEAVFKTTMPLRKSETPDDFAFGIALNGFTMSEALWGMFDPTALLPRDPATVALDLAGKARLLFNFLDPVEVARLGPDDVPAEIESVDINQLRIAALGAELTGQGAFVFENGAEGTLQPMGAVDLVLTGANALIDKLVATGMLPENQAMGARMMMGLLAVPGSAPDTLNSRIEINDQGHVIANGQRIQ